MRKHTVIFLTAALAGGASVLAAQQPDSARSSRRGAPPAATAQRLVVYKSPTCGCCGSWVDYLRAAGFQVDVNDVSDTRLDEISRDSGVPASATSCHTARIGGYVVVGHVPVETIRRMLREKPAITGIAVPGMIAGTPGMGSPGPGTHYDVVAIQRDGSTSVYEHH
jgi:hypothetical protein